MLKKVVCLISVFASIILYVISFMPLKTVEIAVGGKSSGVIKNTSFAIFYDGIAVTYNLDYNYKQSLNLKDCTLQKVEILNGVTNYYYLSKNLPKFELIDGKKVNLQISINSKNVKIGSPIIYGSY